MAMDTGVVLTSLSKKGREWRGKIPRLDPKRLVDSVHRSSAVIHRVSLEHMIDFAEESRIHKSSLNDPNACRPRLL